MKRSDVPVYIKTERPDLNDAISKYTDVQEISPLCWFDLHEDIEAVFFNHPFNTIDSAYAIRNKDTGYTVYVGNDCWQDEAGCKLIKDKLEKIDVALIPYSFIHWYPHLQIIPDEHKINEMEKLNAEYLEKAYLFIRMLRPRATIPFGNSLFFVDGMNHPINKYMTRPHHLYLYGAYSAIAGDYMMEDGLHTVLLNRSEYEELIHAPPDLTKIQERIAKAPFRIPDFEIYVNEVIIDCETLRCRYGVPNSNFSQMKFFVEPREFEKWISCQWTFEEVLGSRRFKFDRKPDEYNPMVIEFLTRCM
jgi:hypothetical protein